MNPNSESQPAANAKPFDVAEVKTLLNLPETSTDIELIQALVELIAGLQQKYDAVLADAVALEDTVKNRDLADFADIIPEGTQAFWENQILANRETAIATLTAIRNSRQAALAAVKQAAPELANEPEKTPAVPPARIPLRNREPAAPRTMQQIASPGVDESRAVKILNRANTLLRNEGIGFLAAFRKAEQEIQ